jgi:hypothetical protein
MKGRPRCTSIDKYRHPEMLMYLIMRQKAILGIKIKRFIPEFSRMHVTDRSPDMNHEFFTEPKHHLWHEALRKPAIDIIRGYKMISKFSADRMCGHIGSRLRKNIKLLRISFIKKKEKNNKGNPFFHNPALSIF